MASTGDNGHGVGYPAASPYVVAVGGTTLVLSTARPLANPRAIELWQRDRVGRQRRWNQLVRARPVLSERYLRGLRQHRTSLCSRHFVRRQPGYRRSCLRHLRLPAVDSSRRHQRLFTRLERGLCDREFQPRNVRAKVRYSTRYSRSVYLLQFDPLRRLP